MKQVVHYQSTFEIQSPDAIVLSLDSTVVSCFGGMDGTATVTPEGGASPYSYSWEDSQTGQTATGLSAGFVSVTVTDDNGCQAIDSIMIEQAEALDLFIEPTDPSCFNGDDGEAVAMPSGGNSPYTYEWSNSQTTATATGLSAGLVTVTITDANNCIIEADTMLGQPTALLSTVDSQTASCLSTPDGEASINISGGIPPYEYLWSDGQTTDVATGLSEGIYHVTVTDANDCILIDSVEVDGTPGIELMETADDVSCNGGNDGFGEVTATGGSGIYDYNWGNGLSNSATQNNLSAQIYVVTVTDEFGCEATIAVEVEEPAALNLNTDVTMIGCAGSASGSASVQASGGTFPYTYLWSNGETTSSIENLNVGTYMVTVTDANDCANSTSVFVDESTPIVITVDVDAADCHGEASGAAQLLVEGGVPPYNYQWPFGLGSSSSIENVIAGTYEVLITDAAGCEILQEVVIPQPLEPLSAEVTPIDVTCFGESDGQLIIDALGGTPSYRYSLDGEFFSGSSVFLGLEAGAYGVLVEDANGCTILLDAVVVDEPAAIEVDLGEDRSIPFGDTIQLFPEVTGGTGLYGYDWFPQDSTVISCYECTFPRIYVDFQVSYKVIVTDEAGCTGEDIITIYAKKDRPVFVPTGFTPNGDSQNDRLMVHARKDIDLNVLYYRVFDRWGELLFEVNDFQPNDPAFGWDGTFRGEDLNGGVYIWHVGVEYIDGLQEDFKGSTTLIR